MARLPRGLTRRPAARSAYSGRPTTRTLTRSLGPRVKALQSGCVEAVTTSVVASGRGGAAQAATLQAPAASRRAVQSGREACERAMEVMAFPAAGAGVGRGVPGASREEWAGRRATRSFELLGIVMGIRRSPAGIIGPREPEEASTGLDSVAPRGDPLPGARIREIGLIGERESVAKVPPNRGFCTPQSPVTAIVSFE